MKYKTRSKLLLALCLASSPVLSANAYPSPKVAEPTGSRARPLSNPTSSVLLADDHCPTDLWVLPPALGVAENRGRVPSETMSDEEVAEICSSMQILRDTSQDLGARTEELQTLVKNLLVRITEKQALLSSLRRRLIELDSTRSLFKSELVNNQDARMELLEELEWLREEYEVLCEEPSSECDELITDIRITEIWESVHKTAEERLEAAIERVDFLRSVAEAKVRETQIELEEVEDELRERQEQVRVLGATLLDLYRQYGKMRGDDVAFAYMNPIDETLSQLRRSNSEYRFLPIVGKDVKLQANLLPGQGEDRYLKNTTFFLGASIEGREVQGDALAFDTLPDEFEGLLHLSMTATCAARDKDTWKLKRNQRGDLIYGTLASYSYEVQSEDYLTVSYQQEELGDFLVQMWSGVGMSSARDARLTADSLVRSGLLSFVFHAEPNDESEKARIKQNVALRLVEEHMTNYGVGILTSTVDFAGSEGSEDVYSSLQPTRERICEDEGGCWRIAWRVSADDVRPEAKRIGRTFNRGRLTKLVGAVSYDPARTR